MIIRNEQITTLENSLAEGFESEMFHHVHQFSPTHCQTMEDTGVRKAIRRGMDAATKYGFTNQGPVRLYIDLTLMFGSSFDTDPLLRWAAEILNDVDTANQMAKAERLHVKALEFAEAIAGPGNQFAKQAFQRARAVRFEELTLPPGDFESACLSRLQAGYPQKFVHAGEPAVRDIIRAALAKAQNHSISTEPGRLLFATFMFAIGHGFAEDPWFPWISNTLQNTAISDPNKRAERLYSKTMTYLDRVIVNLE